MTNKYIFGNTCFQNEKFKIGILFIKNIGYGLYDIDKDYAISGFSYSTVYTFKKMKQIPLLKSTIDVYIKKLVDSKSLVPAKNKTEDNDWIKFEKDSAMFDSGPATADNELEYNITRIYYAGNKKIFNSFINDAFSWFNVDEANAIFNDYSHNMPITKYFNLSEDESNLLLVSYYLWHTKTLDRLWGPLVKEDIDVFLKYMLKINSKKYANMQATSKELVKRQLFSTDGFFCISDATCELIRANTFDDIIKHCFDRVKNKDCYKLDTFNITKENTNLLKDILTSDMPSNILIYGDAGTGKTEYIKSLVLSIGKEAYLFNQSVFNENQESRSNNNNNDESSSSLNSFEYLRLILSLGITDKVLIIDEADRLLSTCPTFFGESNIKAYMNQMLDDSRCKTIWIVNNTNQIDTSTKRRFTYSLHFNKLDNDTLKKSVEREFKSLNIDSKYLDSIVNEYLKYDTTLASLKYVKGIISNILKMNKSNADILGTVKNVLSSNQSLLGNTNKPVSILKNKNYSTDVLNTDIDANEIIDMVRNSLEYRKTNPDIDNSVKMLFYGLPGTGKTAFANYIADKLNKGIIKVKASDILDKYVGGSEENIRNCFKQAEEQNKILLIDEVDNFISNRESSEHSWERTMVNEFLTQMDDFKGILICTTNLINIIDPAIKRRYHIVVNFKAMTDTGIKSLCNIYFKNFNISNEQIDKLSRYNTITPSDFNNVYNRLRFMKKDTINSDFIVKEICTIQDNKSSNKHIGFES